MKVRKLAVALALAGGLGSGVAQALGLGEIELQSYLNEPMDAEIVLPQSQGVDPGDVFVNIAPERAYQRLGLQRNQFLGKLRFDVATRSDGSLVVNVSSREPLREPYLNFLLELTWPNGRLMREYAVLVDPPVYAEESGVSEQVRAPSSAPAAQSGTSTRSAESVRRQARVEQSRASSAGYGADTFGPTGASDTLWTIAAEVRPDNSLSMQQVMLALQDLNPNAFIGNNINRLKRGEVLRVPSADQIRSRTRAEATRAVAQQNEEFQQPRRTVDATVAPQPADGAGAEVASSGGDELKLLVADDEGARSETEGGSAGGDGQLPGGADAGTAVAMEELESARRENDELNTRVDDLQDQVQTLQRLLELKNSQLAEIQQTTVANDAADAAETADLAETADTAETADMAETADAADDTALVSGEEGVAPEQSEEMAGDDESILEPGQENSGEPAAAVGEMDASESDVEQESVSPSDEAADMEHGEGDAEGTATGVEEDATSNDLVPASGDQPAQSEPVEKAEAEVQPKPEPVVADKGFPGNVIDAITGNTLYQIALGGGLIILMLILLLLARRNAKREKAFYEQLNNEPDGAEDSFDLSLDEEESEQGATGNPLEEADAYVAYGRYDQAAQTLETAISREPSRTDLRLKLLGVYADNQDRESFEKQFSEIQILEDDEATAQANELRSRLEEAESMPSIDDLESQLRSGSLGGESTASEPFNASENFENADTSLSDELLADQYDSSREEQVENEFGDFDSDLADFDLDTLEESEKSADAQDNEAEKSSSDDLIEYDLTGLELSKAKDGADADQPEEESDFSSLEIDLDEPEEPKEPLADLAPEKAPETAPETESAAIDSLDESFLDELDAELDKVANEEDELGELEMEESTLDDLELDVSDEDLALMGEFSDSADSANASFEDDELSLEDELSLDDALSEDDLANEDGAPEELTEEPSDEDLPVASDEVQDAVTKSPVAEIDENDLGDDDDFDFLAGTDEAATKLDLARAYIEMGDSDGARDILEEVALEGDDEQKAEAQDLLKNLS
ncbi:FimV/HubP family polar landmark protein [Marinobacter sp. 2_MG-2023]|uniref:FimV/HubP family polar landmark protein n=1 Tax=Marinobacter sp. 2_MG-2023 TaxID=3062679 RepID=UPI0026E1D82E|nr:FimV/HubP family polar landmark protein [Marinobacter sp. 2_MG-2023]MDO6442452.1 FimV/HubP family polar landmark protein [Marinobacter sp. 2_MG-2023]